jgi:RNA polymerase sigma-70 factor, ECF subfamily
MATTTPDINYAPSAMSELHHERVVEFTSVVSRQLPVFHRMALRRLNNVADAEDAVQDALLAAYTHVRQFKGQAQLSTWLTSIVINSARMKLRIRQRRLPTQLEGQEQEHPCSLSESLADCQPDPEQVCRYREVRQLMDHSFRRLSPALRRTLELRTLQGLSIRETANLLELPVGTVKAQLARARKKLKEMMHMRLA